MWANITAGVTVVRHITLIFWRGGGSYFKECFNSNIERTDCDKFFFRRSRRVCKFLADVKVGGFVP